MTTNRMRTSAKEAPVLPEPLGLVESSVSATLVGGWEDSVDAELVAGPSSPVDFPSPAFVVVVSLPVVNWVQVPHWAGQFLRTNSPITESLHLPRYPPAVTARAHGAGSPAPLQSSVVVVVVVALELVDDELVVVVLEVVRKHARVPFVMIVVGRGTPVPHWTGQFFGQARQSLDRRTCQDNHRGT